MKKFYRSFVLWKCTHLIWTVILHCSFRMFSPWVLHPTPLGTLRPMPLTSFSMRMRRMSSSQMYVFVMLSSKTLTVVTLPTVPHLFWRASYCPVGELPSTFDCLLDVGSHLVIIREDMVDKLKLRRRRLWKPIFIETAMHNGRKNAMKLWNCNCMMLLDMTFWNPFAL